MVEGGVQREQEVMWPVLRIGLHELDASQLAFYHEEM